MGGYTFEVKSYCILQSSLKKLKFMLDCLSMSAIAMLRVSSSCSCTKTSNGLDNVVNLVDNEVRRG